MNNPTIPKIIAGFLLSCLVGCGYSTLDKAPETKDLAGTYLPGHSVVITTKNAYSNKDLLSLHITLSTDQTIEAILPDGRRSQMGTNKDGHVEHMTGTWSIEKDNKDSLVLFLKLKNSLTQEEQDFSLSLAEHGDQPILGLNVITDKTKWFGLSDTPIQKEVWFRKKNDKLDAYLEKNLSEEPKELPEA